MGNIFKKATDPYENCDNVTHAMENISAYRTNKSLCRVLNNSVTSIKLHYVCVTYPIFLLILIIIIIIVIIHHHHAGTYILQRWSRIVPTFIRN